MELSKEVLGKHIKFYSDMALNDILSALAVHAENTSYGIFNKNG
jgi:hypothetical protein